MFYFLQVKQLIQPGDIPLQPHQGLKLKSGLVEVKNGPTRLKTMLRSIAENTKMLFKPPILRFTIISITINLTFHIG